MAQLKWLGRRQGWLGYCSVIPMTCGASTLFNMRRHASSRKPHPMDVPHEIPRASRLVSELALLQLLVVFTFSLARADPFVIGAAIGL